MIFNLAIVLIAVVLLLLALVVIDALCGDWLQAWGFWED